MDLGFDGCIRAWQGPDFRSTFVDPAQETWTFSLSRPHIFAEVGNRAEHHARIDGLNHIRRGEADRNAQGQVHENMGFDKGTQQKIIGIKKDDIFARTRRETFLRREALTAGIFPPQYFRVRILPRNIEKNTGAAIAPPKPMMINCQRVPQPNSGS